VAIKAAHASEVTALRAQVETSEEVQIAMQAARRPAGAAEARKARGLRRAWDGLAGAVSHAKLGWSPRTAHVVS
jgi:hypothetical protein